MSINSNKDFLRWEVKPILRVYYRSEVVGGDQQTFEIYGLDRGDLTITRNWEKIHSVEQFNQGYVAKPTDFIITIAVKEHGAAFEKLRRLSKGGIIFDVEVDLVRVSDQPYGDKPLEHEEDENYLPWMNGFEKFKGCIVNREGSTIELATFPVREFECQFLRHTIKESVNGVYQDIELEEGDGTYPTLADLSI